MYCRAVPVLIEILNEMTAPMKTAPYGSYGAVFYRLALVLVGLLYTENDEPQPQVEEALGFLMTNWAPVRSSL